MFLPITINRIGHHYSRYRR